MIGDRTLLVSMGASLPI